MSWRLGVDIGGTFTDFALQKGEEIILDKTLSTPDDRSLAVMTGIESLAEREGLAVGELLARIETIVHGTTIADNTLIEMNGAKTGLLTTEGFRDELELRRGFKEDIWDVRLEPPPPIVPRRRRLTVPERIRHDGTVHRPLDEAAARAAIRRLANQGVESIAISLVFSFANPAHEQRLAELVVEELPDVDLSLSHVVLPRAPEFERTSTTVVNAYVGPRVTRYLERLTTRLREAGFDHELLVMQCTGGVMTSAYLRGAPVRILASGPAAGVVGGAAIGAAKRAPDLLCVDMGGTSYDISVVRGGAAPAEASWNWHHRYLVAVPMIAVETLGAGGGSICRVRKDELCVGPESAGADPGPVCYGRGGELPTVTDAALVLGLLSEQAEFAGGRMQLTRAGVDAAFEKHVAGPLGYGIAQAAFDCWRVVNANMVQAVRRSTAGKGIDPSELTMLAYGGNGGVVAGVQAQELGIERVLVPRTSPAFSALGALSASPAIDEERAYLASAHAADVARLRDLWASLSQRAASQLSEAGYSADAIESRFLLSLRYPGQNWSLPVEVERQQGEPDPAFVTAALRDAAIEQFHRRHEQEYGYRRAEEDPELTSVRLVTAARVPKPEFGGGYDAPRRDAEPASQRRANLGRGFEETAVHLGRALEPGHVVAGPAIIEESFTTIVVYPGWEARVDDARDYELVRVASEAALR
jgi:N-methylhydantoinase A